MSDRHRHGPHWTRGASLATVLCLLAAGCHSRTESSLVVVPGAAGATGAEPESVHASWAYLASDVTVEAELITTRGEDGCQTEGRLVVDKAVATADRYVSDPLPCSDLELTATGDILVYGLTTDHDWSTEALGLNRDRELLTLGPWSSAETPDLDYRFEVSAPDCGACSCARLVRRAGGEDALLELGRDCD